jgi:hypothetical protein
LKRVQLRLLLPLLILATCFVQAQDVSFKILNNVVNEVSAGASVNLMAQIINSSKEKRTVEIRLKSKTEGWKILNDYSSLVLPSESTSRKIIGVFVPNNQVAGVVPVELEVVDKTSGTVIATESYQFSVKFRYGISIEVVHSPKQLFSGDTASVSYLILNESNTDVVTELEIRAGTDVKTEKISLKKEASILYKYPIRIPKNNTSNEQRSIMANIVVLDKPETVKSTSTTVDIFKIGQEKFDKYNRYNIQITGVGAYTSAYGKPIYSGIYDIHGLGIVGNPNKNRQLEFKIRGPNRNGNPLFGLNDEYAARFFTRNTQIRVGDYSYGLSNLTESSRYGRGASVDLKFNKLSVGGFYSIPRYYPLVRAIYSGFSTFSWNEKNQLQAGYVAKNDTLNNTTHLVSIAAKNQFLKWLNSTLEFSLGNSNASIYKAYRVGIMVNTKWMGTSIDYTYADKYFPGYFSNAQRINSSLSFFLKPISISFTYGNNRANQALDTLVSKPPITENASVNTSVSFLKYFSLNFGGMMSSSKEDSPTPLFDYQRYNARVGFVSQFKHFNISIQGDGGKLRNYLVNEGVTMSDFFTGNLSTQLTFDKLFTANGNVSYQMGQKGITGSETIYYGVGMTTNFLKDYSLSFTYNSNFEWMYYTSDRNLLSLNLNADINENNKLSLATNYNLLKNTLDNKTFNAQIRYTHTLRVPISKRKDVGAVAGKLINKGVEKVSGVRVNVGSRMAITDKDGSFKIGGLSLGPQTLIIDGASFGLHSIAEKSGPYILEILPAKTTYFELAVTKSARIQGEFQVQEDERANEKGFIQVSERLERLVVEANSGSEVFRVLSDVNGGFSFNDLRPGTWEIKVYPNGLPKGYNLLTPNFTITLVPEQDERIVVKLEKKARQIQFQRSF